MNGEVFPVCKWKVFHLSEMRCRGGGPLEAEVLEAEVPAAEVPWRSRRRRSAHAETNQLLTHGRIEGVTGDEDHCSGADDQTPPPPPPPSLISPEKRSKGRTEGLQRSRLETPCGTGSISS
ncbi:unnamed protein product [Boreogadus saida]